MLSRLRCRLFGHRWTTCTPSLLELDLAIFMQVCDRPACHGWSDATRYVR